MDQTNPRWLVKDGRPLDPNALGTGIFLFPDGSGVLPRKQFNFPMTYSECKDFANSRNVQEFKWVPEHIADISTLSATPCGQRCNDFAGCDGGCLCDDKTEICE